MLVKGNSKLGCRGRDKNEQVTVPEGIYGAQEDQVESKDVGSVESECQGIQRQIATLSVGNDTSAGVDFKG